MFLHNKTGVPKCSSNSHMVQDTAMLQICRGNFIELPQQLPVTGKTLYVSPFSPLVGRRLMGKPKDLDLKSSLVCFALW